MPFTEVVIKYHKVILYLTTLGLVVYGVLAIITPEVLSTGFQKFTAQDWMQFQVDGNLTAAYILLLWRLIGIFNLMAGLVLTLIVWKWLKFGSKWSWIALFIGTILAYLGPMITDLTVRSIEIFEIIEFAFFGLFLTTMLIVRESYWAILEKN